jgi:hypothetical protein
VAAAAQGNRGLASGNRKGVARRIDDRERTFDEHGAIIAQANRDLGHAEILVLKTETSLIPANVERAGTPRKVRLLRFD